jgi:hypothetical protein
MRTSRPGWEKKVSLIRKKDETETIPLPLRCQRQDECSLDESLALSLRHGSFCAMILGTRSHLNGSRASA